MKNFLILCPCVSQNFVFHKNLIDSIVYGQWKSAFQTGKGNDLDLAD